MNIGTHKTHCCIMHGCKYFDDNCPVVLDQIEQEYICEDCQHTGIKSVKEVRKLFKAGKRKCETCGRVYKL